ncbi:hypothetical protein, variant 2 [Aphanomyces invadans]|uniref:subtilisin n=1 Tax=Aphanomyces invadans TaxID=157072 RepID=A0A024U4V1_9STRA|nr:hypothetical protein, variant 2 [Aphanomyces invadans]ETW01406.1 hypothetical protein, variant 2 [Aphanomyces invadans]|eukprot:XP_008870404.1 hypothetical protein, variant 2 [Aphanomyces invadans]
MGRRRRNVLRAGVLLLGTLACFSLPTTNAAMTFASDAAWCDYHCSSYNPTKHSSCPVLCPHARVLKDEVDPLHLVLCLSNATATAKPMYQATMDLELDGPDPVLTACSLAALPASTSFEAPSPTSTLPTLVKLTRSQVEHTIIAQIRALLHDASSLRLLSRSNEIDAGSTVALVHATTSEIAAIKRLTGVYHVLPLPPFMKLSPLARSLMTTTTAIVMSPPLDIAFLDHVALDAALLTRLNAGLANITGVDGLLHLSPMNDSVVMPSLANFETWVKAVLWLCRHPTVLYVTKHTKLQTQTLPPSMWTSRRLDADTSNLMGTLEAQSNGILGNGVVVAVTDSGLYMDHDQFDQPTPREFNRINLNARKVVLYHAIGDRVEQSETVTCGHGTHVAGIVAGSSFSGTSTNVGLAPNAKIAFADIGTQDPVCANQPGVKCPVRLATPSNVLDLLGRQLDAGARIFSFSWGLPGDDYSRQARDFDQFVVNNPETLLVIAAGNSGDNGSGTITSPAGAKNALTVGASLSSVESLQESLACPTVFNPQSVASFSSQGPTSDGRLKPDVVAPGQILVSAQSEASYSTVKTSRLCPLQGTSQSTPVVAGMAVLLHEWLRDGWWKDGVLNKAFGMTSIPAALIKALIIHSSRGLTRRLNNIRGMITCKFAEAQAQPLRQYPDNMQGYGLPDMSTLAAFGQSLPKVYFLPNTSSANSPSIAHKGVHIYSFDVRPKESLRVTLVWNDPPGAMFATKMLQNDLDLSISIPNSTVTIYPLSGTNGGKDSVNNVEMVVAPYDLLRQYTNASANDAIIRVEARVVGFSVLVGLSQPYALVASAGMTSARGGDSSTFPSSTLNKTTAPSSAVASRGFVWESWMTITLSVLGGVLVLVGAVVLIVRRFRTADPEAPYVTPQQTPRGDATWSRPYPAGVRGSVNDTGGRSLSIEQDVCPYCGFLTRDAVSLVDHVQRFHP